uniref:Uncharacterized protein n=1 Tax=Panagrolaimus superbus TaxID=310955 RepID=A0A914Y8U5_9BILA
MSAKELMEINDLCTTLVVDPLLRIKSHKVLLDYTPPSMHTHLLASSIMLQYINDGDILKVYRSLYSMQITRKLFKNRSIILQQHFRDHLLRFIAMFSNDSGYVISDCIRYGHDNNLGAKININQILA